MAGVDGPNRFCTACPHRLDEFPMEADIESLVHEGMGTNWLEDARSPVHCLAPTWRDSVVCDTAYVGSRRCASYGLPGRRDRLIRSNWGTISAACPTHNGDARLAGNLFARRTPAGATAVPSEYAKVSGRMNIRT